MMLCVCATLILCLVLPDYASSFRGQYDVLPSLDELKRFGSLMDRFSTHDGEIISAPVINSSCVGQTVEMTRVTFVALPSEGLNTTELVIRQLSGEEQQQSLFMANLTFGMFGYELPLNPPVTITIGNETMLWIRHPPYEESALRLLYQVGGAEARNVCWSFVSGPESLTCELTFEYPLLVIETDPPGCIEGPVSAAVLKRYWDNRTLPILYTSPERKFSIRPKRLVSTDPYVVIDCSHIYFTWIYIGGYLVANGDTPVPDIEIRINENISYPCNFTSTERIYEDYNVYRCNMSTAVTAGEGSVLSISQRYSRLKIAFLYDGLTEIPFITTCCGLCFSDSLIPGTNEIFERTRLNIPDTNESITADRLRYSKLVNAEDGELIKWRFVGRQSYGQGQSYPHLIVFRPIMHTLYDLDVMNTNCSTTSYANVYECNVNYTVLAGDYLGFALPNSNDSIVLLNFFLNGYTDALSWVSWETFWGLPLASLEIERFQSTVYPTSTIISAQLDMLSYDVPTSEILETLQRITVDSSHTVATQTHSQDDYIGPTMDTQKPSPITYTSLVLPSSSVGDIRILPSSTSGDTGTADQEKGCGGSGGNSVTVIIGIFSAALLLLLSYSIIVTAILIRTKIPRRSNNKTCIVYGNENQEYNMITNQTDTIKTDVTTSFNESYKEVKLTSSNNPAYAANSIKEDIKDTTDDVYSTTPATDETPAPCKTHNITTTFNESYKEVMLTTSDNLAYTPSNIKGDFQASVDDTYSTTTTVAENPASSETDITTKFNESYKEVMLTTTDSIAYTTTTHKEVPITVDDSYGRITAKNPLTVSFNESYKEVMLTTSNNPAYTKTKTNQTVPTNGTIATAVTGASSVCDKVISTSKNLSYVPTESDGTNTLSYDYPRK